MTAPPLADPPSTAHRWIPHPLPWVLAAALFTVFALGVTAPTASHAAGEDEVADDAPTAGEASVVTTADDGTPATDESSGGGEDGGAVATSAETECAATDDFPTTAVADYVLGCMAANGNTYEALQQCSCSIDFIKSRMDYKAYEAAGTVLQVQRDIGQRGIFYRDSKWAKSRVERLEALQAESTLRCF